MLQFLGGSPATRGPRHDEAQASDGPRGEAAAPAPSDDATAGVPTIDPSPVGGVEWLPRPAPHRWI